jgi:hypothetical protein
MDKITYSIESYKNIQELIKFADQKSGAVLVVTGIIFTGYVQYLDGLLYVGLSNATLLGSITFVSSIATLISLVTVVYITIFGVLKPRKSKHYEKEEVSLLYYDHIVQTGKIELLSKYQQIDEATMLKNVVDQQYEVANILNQKTNALIKSFNYLFISAISVMTFIILSNQL